MANTLTIQLRPTKKYDPPDVKNLFHNTGISKATYWLKDSNSIISNIDLKNLTPKKVIDLWNEWEKEATELVVKNKGRNPQKKQVLIEEGLMVIGRDVKVENEEDLIKIFNEFKEFFEKKYNTKIFAYFYHNHEGHIDGDSGEFIPNRHIHFFFRNVDIKGNSVRRQIKKTDLSNFQTKIYEIGKKYIPDLERAINYKKLGLKAPKHIPHREYRTRKIKEELLPKLVEKIKENKELKKELARVKDLKEENKRLRALLKELGAEREDYAYLEDYIRKLKEFIKQKILPEKQLKAKIKELEEKLRKMIEEKKKIINELEEENQKLKEKFEKNKEVLEFYKKKVEIHKVTLITINSQTLFYIESFLKEKQTKGEVIDYKKLNNETTLIETPYSTIIDKPKEIEIEFAINKGDLWRFNQYVFEQEVSLLIDLALAKGWKLQEIQATGSEKFVNAVNKEIKKRLKEGENYDNSFKYKYN